MVFGSLPARRTPITSRPLFASVLFHAIAVTVALTIQLSSDLPPAAEVQEVTLVAPRLSPPPRLKTPRLKPTATPPPRPPATPPPAIETPALVRTAPREFRASTPAPTAAPRAVDIAVPAPEIAITVPVPSTAPRADLSITLPKPVITGVLSSAVSTPETPAAPTSAVTSAGFGATQTASTATPRRSATSVGGFGTTQAQTGRTTPGSPASVGGFGSAGAPANAPRQTATLKNAAFGDAKTAAPDAPAQHTNTPAAATPVEIVSKPRPVYTEEARALRIEGEVTLEVLFTAAGEARVVRVLRGLGHGLNESATAAARAIEFRPAKRAGVAVDSTAQVRIVFQLAY